MDNATTNAQLILDLTRAFGWIDSNQASIDVYTNRLAPMVRNTPAARQELTSLFWGMFTAEVHLEGKPDKGVTNVRKSFITARPAPQFRSAGRQIALDVSDAS